MPDCAPENRNRYDSLFRANTGRLEKATTLLVDIRNNYGGVIDCFLPLLAYVCDGSDVRIPASEPDWVNFVRQYYRQDSRP